MTRKIIGVMLVGALALGGACGKKDKEKAKDKPAPAAKTTDEAKTPPPPKDLTAEQRVEFFKTCWAAFNAKDKAKFTPCYAENTSVTMMDSGQPTVTGRDTYINEVAGQYWTAFPDAQGTPQLTLVSGNRLVSVELYQGTNSGSFMGMPPTGKKVGYHFLHDFTMSGPGPIEKSDTYIDMATVMGQIGMSPAPHRAVIEEAGEAVVAIAADDDKEKANIEIAKKSNEAFNSHDVDAVMAHYADDVLFRDMTMPADITNKKDMAKGLAGFYKAFPDINGEYGDIIAAGDYVAMFSVMTGTNKGAMPDMGLEKPTGKSFEMHGAEILKIEDGKITEHWMFANGMSLAIQLGLMPDPAAAPADKGAPAKKAE